MSHDILFRGQGELIYILSGSLGLTINPFVDNIFPFSLSTHGNICTRLEICYYSIFLLII